MFLDEIIARRDHPDTRLPAQVVLQPQHRDGCVLIEELRDLGALFGIVTLLLTEISRSRIRGKQKSERVPAYLPSQLAGDIGTDDRSRVDCLQRRAKNIDALQKERTLLFKENWEALIRRDHGLVGFHVGEIRVQREAGSHVRSDSILQGESGLELRGLINELSRIG